MDDGFRKWQRENAEELNNWYSDEDLIRRELDKSGEFATMDTGRIASIMVNNPEIPDPKIYEFMLRPGSKHNVDFVEAGYASPADGERLRNDIILKCREQTEWSNLRYDSKYKGVRWEKYIQLGPGHRFVTAWMIKDGSEIAQLITCHRKEL